MDPETVAAVGKVIADTWALIGPVVGGVIGALLAARNQRSSDRVRLRAEADLAQRAATRDMYINLLGFLSDYQAAILAYSARSYRLQDLTEEERNLVFPMDLWRVMSDRVNNNDDELARRVLVLSAVGHPKVAAATKAAYDAFSGPDGSRQMFVSKAEHWARFNEAVTRVAEAIAEALGTRGAEALTVEKLR